MSDAPAPARLRRGARRGRRDATRSCAPGRARRRSPWRCGPPPGLRVRVLLDERAAGFFALGHGPHQRPAGRPARHVGDGRRRVRPAVVEASLSRVPLVVLTADRPPELRDRGAPQTIDQDRILRARGEVVRGAAAARRRPGDEAHVRSVGGSRRRDGARPGRPGRSSSTSRSASRSLPDGAARRPTGRRRRRRRRSRRSSPGRPALDADAVAELAARLGGRGAGLIVAGPHDDPALPAALARLAARDRLPDPRRPAVRRAERAARPVAVRRPRRPARPARAVARRPRPGPRHPVRGDADLEADRCSCSTRAARAARGRRRRAAGASRR